MSKKALTKAQIMKLPIETDHGGPWLPGPNAVEGRDYEWQDNGKGQRCLAWSEEVLASLLGDHN